MKTMTATLCRTVQAYATLDFRVPDGADANTISQLAQAAYLRSYLELDGTALDFEPDYSADDPVRFTDCSDSEATARLLSVDTDQLQCEAATIVTANLRSRKQRTIVRRSEGDDAVIAALDAEWRHCETPAIITAFAPAMATLEPEARIEALVRAIDSHETYFLYFGERRGNPDELGYWLTDEASGVLKNAPERLHVAALTL